MSVLSDRLLVDQPVNIDTVKLGLLHADGVREILIWLREVFSWEVQCRDGKL
jgi:hypothetical protein